MVSTFSSMEADQAFSFSTNFSETPLLQKRVPVGAGHPRRHGHDGRRIGCSGIRCAASSACVGTVSSEPGMAVKKLGQPEPDSYFISDVNRGWPQPAQTNTPGRCSSFNGLVKARSVASWRSTSKAAGSSFLRQSSCRRSVASGRDRPPRRQAAVRASPAESLPVSCSCWSVLHGGAVVLVVPRSGFAFDSRLRPRRRAPSPRQH